MAEVYRRVKGMEIQKLIGHVRVVQRSLGTHGAAIAARARTNLAAHKDEGHAFIETSTGDMDVWVTLNDERGQAAAMSIEFGREATIGEDGKATGGMRGTRVLRDAAGLDGSV
jgi:hypothetical protein